MSDKIGIKVELILEYGERIKQKELSMDGATIGLTLTYIMSVFDSNLDEDIKPLS